MVSAGLFVGACTQVLRPQMCMKWSLGLTWTGQNHYITDTGYAQKVLFYLAHLGPVSKRSVGQGGKVGHFPSRSLGPLGGGGIAIPLKICWVKTEDKNTATLGNPFVCVCLCLSMPNHIWGGGNTNPGWPFARYVVYVPQEQIPNNHEQL